MTSWGRGASGGMSQSMIGGVGNDAKLVVTRPQSGRGGNQDYRTMPGATKSAFFPPKDGDRGLDSLRSQNTGTFSIAINKNWLIINSENDDKLDAVFNYDGLSSSTGLKPLTMSTENKTICVSLTKISFCDS